MPLTVNVNVGSTDSITKAIREIEKYRRRLEKKRKELCERFASIGAISVSLGFGKRRRFHV